MSSSKDDESFVESDSSERRMPNVDAPRVVDGMVEFSLASVVQTFTCQICNGIFREPVTITECLHTFCKSCLFSLFAKGSRQCPTCDTELGTDPYSMALNDRTLEELSDKVLFPGLKEADDAAERAFYASQGIRLKPEYADSANETSLQSERKFGAIAAEADDEITFSLVPDDSVDSALKLPNLNRTSIRTSGRLKVVQLKKYILQQLNMPPTRLPSVEIVCSASPVGNELTLAFIHRTMWAETDKPFKLCYRLAQSTW